MIGHGKVDLKLFLERLNARSVLSEEEQAAVLAIPAKRVDVKARTDIIRLNERTETSCYVAAGLIGRVGETTAGARQITALHIPGDMSDLHSAVRPIGVGGLTALCDTTTLRIPHVAIRGIAARYPAIAEAFWRDCMLDMAVLLEWTVSLGRRSASVRLAHLFCELAIRNGDSNGARLTYGLRMTQEQLGDATGLTSVHVNRSLKSLREAGLVMWARGSVTIPDWEQLIRHADFDPSYLLADTAPDRQRRLLEAA